MPDSQSHPPADRDMTRVFDPKALDGSTRTVEPFDENGLTRSASGGPPAEPAPPPDGVPGYTIVRELGRGGMGVVYLAKQAGLNRDVALKMVLAGGHASAAERIRFLAEAESVAAVQHPGIVQVFDFGTHAGQPFFALEYLPGGSLADALQKTLPEPLAAARLIEKLSRAVHAAHAKGIIHRDLKPSNILLDSDGSPKVTDFGLARKTDSGSGLTQTGAVIGTPSYMSPEQASGQHHKTGPETDVYAVGAILYECLTGRPPFRAATAVDTVMQVVSEEPVPPHRLVPKLPRDLETVCLKCLQKDPAKRYPSAEALADDLGRYLAGDSIVARPVPLWEKGWRWTRRHPSYFVAAGFMIVSIVASIVLLASKNASLIVERNAARQAQLAASAASLEAEEQRKKATARLERAVEAVERMMVRVASEKWANRPELQQDRQEVLEEAIAFFRTFGAEDSQDPIVRRQAARAYFHSAAAYLALGEMSKGREMANSAAEIYRGLAEDAPSDATPLRGQAEATAMLGHTAAVGGQYEDAILRYQEAAKLAERAVSLDSSNADSHIVLAETNSAMAMYYSISNPPRAAEYNAKTLSIAEGLMSEPEPGYKSRLLMVATLTNIAALDINAGRFEVGMKKLERARAEVPAIERMKAPTAQAAERFTLARSSLSVLYGVVLFRQGKRDEGIESVRTGIRIITPLVTAQPKSFPIRYQMLQHELAHAELLMRSGNHAKAEESYRRVDVLRDSMMADNPAMTWLKSLGTVQKSILLIEKARNGQSAEVEVESEKLLKGLEERAAQTVRYNVACAFAQLAKFGAAAKRPEFAQKAVAELDNLLDTTYFQSPGNRSHLDDDTDLDPLREREDFKGFLARAKAVRTAVPMKRESAPPPRKIELK